VIGHEVVAVEESGAPVVLEINASHAARGLRERGWCPHCTRDLPTHCPERLVLGIHDLPGGFGPWVLAPVGSVVAVPAGVDAATATLVEPFAAALHAVRSLAPGDGERVAVLGPRRLGSLVIAALAAWRAQTGRRFSILAVARRAEMRALARDLGADEALDAGEVAARQDVAEVVIDTTGSPDGLARAAALARRDVHLKSTTGLPAFGLSQATALVVDEVTVVPWGAELVERPGLASPPPRVAAVLGDVPAAVRDELERGGLRVVAGDDAAALAARLAREPDVALGAADVVVVTSLAGIDAALRPRAGVEQGLVRARGTIAVVDVGQPRSGLVAPLLEKGLRVSTSRCGDLHEALALLAAAGSDLGRSLGRRLLTDRFPASRLADAFAAAAGPHSVKVAVTHPDGLLG
jgi:threonine dehydrogenase-like Zn-dependent dehydrogenase